MLQLVRCFPSVPWSNVDVLSVPWSNVDVLSVPWSNVDVLSVPWSNVDVPSVSCSNVDATPLLHASAEDGKSRPRDCCSLRLVLLAASCSRSTLLS